MGQSSWIRKACPRSSLADRPWVVLLVLTLLASLIYSNTFSVPFVFDDIINIIENPQIKNLTNFWDFTGSRYMALLSFALNYAVGGLQVFGYHLVNLLIHISNAFLVYCLVRLLFCTPMLATSEFQPAKQAVWIAFATALLFVSHPIQTQAVTYISQRFASLVSLFYLLAVVCYLAWRLHPQDQRSRYLWYGLALLATGLAMKTKENSFTLPLMLCLVEATFFWPLLRRRWVSLAPFLLTLLIIPFSRLDVWLLAGGGVTQQTTEISRSAYLFTQFRVILTYLRLLVFPVNQNLDYDYPIYHSLSAPPVFFSGLFLVALLGLALTLLVRAHRIPQAAYLRLPAFGLLWFFLALSVESSIVPLWDVITEQRMYLPSVGVFIAVAAPAMILVWDERRQMPSLLGLGCLGTALMVLSIATYQRNLVWQDPVTLWQDVTSKSPKKARGYNNLGVVYDKRGRLELALQQYRVALALAPNYPDALNNLGTVYKDKGNLEEAIQAFERALQLKPDHAEAHYNLGAVYKAQGDWEAALREFQQALRIKPESAEAHNNLGSFHLAQGRLNEAIQAFERALMLNPDFADVYNNLGLAHKAQGRWQEAIRDFQHALFLKPGLAESHNNLGNLYRAQGQWEEAIQTYQQALALKPEFADAYNNLGTIYAEQGRLKEAILAFEQAVQLQPGRVETHYNLGQAYQLTGQTREARKEFERALQIKPDLLPARQALEALSQ